MIFYDTEFEELKQKVFFSKLRSELFKKITKKQSGVEQWRYIIGKQNRKKTGELITINEQTKNTLQEIVDYYNTEEGKDILRNMDIELPSHIDDVISWIRESIDSKELKNEIFRFQMKNKPF